MKIIKVNDKKSANQFLLAAKLIYKNDKFWVCPPDAEIESIFDPKQNVFFQHGVCTRWILYNDKGELIGRVASFINDKKAKNYDQPTGGMGFFECINDKEAAYLLFDTCKEWLQQRGMQAMDGPINFGENDRYWGLLVDGFMTPGYGMQYHHPYYKELFESYNFKYYFEQVSNHLDIKKPFPERFWKIAEWVSKKKEFHFEHFHFSKAEKYINDLKTVYDAAWAFHENFTPIEYNDLYNTLQKAKSIIDEEFIWFAYNESEPIAFLVMFPDINQVLKHLNGKMNFLTKLKFAFLVKKKTITRARMVIMGVTPKFQKSGIESALFYQLDKVMKKKPWYTELELSWVGDFNPKMRALHESVGAVFGKRHITYRKLFNDGVSFNRSTIIPMNTKEKALKNK